MADGVVNCLNATKGECFIAYHGDCVEILRQLPDASIGFSVYSPPFSGLYIYNDSICDMGNVASDDEFAEQYGFFVRELYRVMKPGRIVAVHCKDLVYYRNQRGTAGLRDFPGLLIRVHTEAGFDFHSRVTIWRDPVREMTKTKAHGLLYKQLRADSSFSRQGLPEYLCIFRKWADDGDETIEPVTHTHQSFPLNQWQQWASPVWMDTRETDVLEAREVRAVKDEKHICPMPLDLTTRAITLWSNERDTVLSPFMGIGSEGYCALKAGRRFVGIELKETYWRQACETLKSLDAQSNMFETKRA
jgi:DNA modification methylase